MLGFCRVAVFALSGLLFSTFSVAVTLAATEYPTLVDQRGEASRYSAVVTEAFERMQQPLKIQVMRPAFLGSALLSEKVDGELMFTALDEQKERMTYSAPYAPALLYLASRRADVIDVSEFYHIEGARVASENRFVNTPELRAVSAVKWSRNPTAFDAFKQIADERSDYLLADAMLLNEFNLMLLASKRAPLFLSAVPMVTSSIHLSLRKSLPNAQQIIERFNQTILEMQQDGTYDQLLYLDLTGRESLLDEARYKRMMDNW